MPRVIFVEYRVSRVLGEFLSLFATVELVCRRPFRTQCMWLIVVFNEILKEEIKNEVGEILVLLLIICAWFFRCCPICYFPAGWLMIAVVNHKVVR